MKRPNERLKRNFKRKKIINHLKTFHPCRYVFIIFNHQTSNSLNQQNTYISFYQRNQAALIIKLLFIIFSVNVNTKRRWQLLLLTPFRIRSVVFLFWAVYFLLFLFHQRNVMERLWTLDCTDDIMAVCSTIPIYFLDRKYGGCRIHLRQTGASIGLFWSSNRALLLMQLHYTWIVRIFVLVILCVALVASTCTSF